MMRSLRIRVAVAGAAIALLNLTGCFSARHSSVERSYNKTYTGEELDYIAFPIGGIGAGMFCLDGTGSISHMSIRNKPEIFHDPVVFGAIHVKGEQSISKVIEGPVPDRKLFGVTASGDGLPETSHGLPRFDKAEFHARFPFASIRLEDSAIPLDVVITGWSPFIPGDPDNSSLPVGALEYTFKNPTSDRVPTRNFIRGK